MRRFTPLETLAPVIGIWRRTGLLVRNLLLIAGLAVLLFGNPVKATGLSDEDARYYEAAFLAADLGKWPDAFRHAKKASDPLPAIALNWLYYRDRKNDADFSEISAFIDSYPDWPYLSLLQKHAEERLDGSEDPKSLIAWYRDKAPVTARGATALALALTGTGHGDAAVDIVRRAWVELDIPVKEEYGFRKQFRGDLRTEDHLARLERLLWTGRVSAAKRQAARVGPETRALAEARIALQRMSGGVDRAISRVPAALQNHPGLVYERLRWRRAKGRDESAAELLSDQPDTVEYENLWWRERSILARRFLRDGNPRRAYEIASRHKATDGFPFADAEWFSGFVALRFLNEPEVAFGHFRAMYENVQYPVSLSRGAYWAGRAAEAAGKSLIAYKWYDVAARHTTSFYGQMAAHHLTESKRPPLPADPIATADEKAAFDSTLLAKLIPMLVQAKARKPAASLIRHLGRNADNPAGYNLVASLAIKVGLPGEAVYVARQAIKAGTVLIEAGYPELPVPPGLALPSEIVFGLIRQESGFDQYAISSAGARGLMQLMPGTAQNTARKQNVSYRKDSLTDDTGYNMSLGTAYLDGLLEDVDGSLVMALAGYNAGPSRARRWVNDFGDPRRSIEEAIDWIEMIPYYETRNYVQRVLENITVYRQRSASSPVIVAFSTQSILSQAASR
ncbi:MAG: lytic transglycosylase domain-containing protein [Alphaproteobacteria bacterium]